MANPNNTKKILVWSTILAMLGVGAYLGFKLYKKKKSGSGDNPLITPEKSEIESQSVIESVVNNGAESPFKTTTEIKAFQDWLDITHPLWVNDNGKWKNLRIGTATEPTRHVSGKGYGTYGKSTASAYSKWGSEYAVKPSKNNSDIISYISQNSIGKTLEIEERLSKASPKFINAWYNAIILRKSSSNKKGTTFLYNEEVYDSFYGIKRIQFNPIGKLADAKKDAYAYKSAEIGASKVGVLKGQKVGIVKGYVFSPKDKNIWLYVPDTVVNFSLTQTMDIYNEFRWIPLSNFWLVVPYK